MTHIVWDWNGTLVADHDVVVDSVNAVMRAFGREPITIFYVVMLAVTALAGIVVQPHIMGVCGAGRTEMEGRFGFTVGNFIKRICTVAWTFTGLACVIWYLSPGISPLDAPLRQRLAWIPVRPSATEPARQSSR